VRCARYRSRPRLTCPTIRVHPAIVAQAAATSAVLTGGKFILGRIGDGFVTTRPDQDMIMAFRAAGGEGKPIHAGRGRPRASSSSIERVLPRLRDVG
jgi:hypothetical protein